MTREIVINEVKRESEKAMLINVAVSWNDNVHQKDIWMPKSVVKVEDNHAFVEDWFCEKLAQQNAFNGYKMQFAMIF